MKRQRLVMHKYMIRTHKGNCQNCGTPADLEYFEFIHEGINLCFDCGDLPVKKVSKKGESNNWVQIDGEFYPPNYPISQRAK